MRDPIVWLDHPDAGARRIGGKAASRGGSWRHAVRFTRVTARASLSPERRYNDFGFRLYADAQAPAASRI